MISFIVLFCLVFAHPIFPCVTDDDCDDFKFCTIDSCSASSVCENVLESCDDSDACTTDICSEDAGCTHTETDCTTDPCFSGCDSTTGCIVPCPECIKSTNNGISTKCNGDTAVDTLDANTINTGTLNVGGAKKRGLSSGTALNVNGGVTVSGPLTTTDLTTTNFITNSVTVTGSLTISTDDGSSSFDLSQGIDTKGITCTSLDVEGPSTVDSLSAKDIELIKVKFTTDNDPWWGNSPGTAFIAADPSRNSGYRFFILGGDSELYEIPIQSTTQYGTQSNSCYFGQCKAGLTCKGKKCQP
jgi:hypothetical protein